MAGLKQWMDENEIPVLLDFLRSLPPPSHPFILRNEILLAFEEHAAGLPGRAATDATRSFLHRVQEALWTEGQFIMVYRHRRAGCRILAMNVDQGKLNEITTERFLAIKERLIKPGLPPNQRTMKIDFAPFYESGPNLKDPQKIGNGIRHLNRAMSATIAREPEKWNHLLYEFLKLHHLAGVQLLIDPERVRNTPELESAIEEALDYLAGCQEDLNPATIRQKLNKFGFLEGWGDSRHRITETMGLLRDILEQPDESTLEEFLARIPMISKVVMLTPHGWFGQKNVLGRPDTGGQIVYVLDQARALERFLEQDLKQAGLLIRPKILIVTRLIPENQGTTSHERLEKVMDSNNVWILRVPFRDGTGDIVPHWLSRFRVWPYLDQFAVDAEQEIRGELMGRPDLIIGNYSDGNLAATRIAKSMGVTQAMIAHALEKAKYLFSDLYWEEAEQEHHFSVQFAADLLAMNSADFIISSTVQEITGTESSIGQYESYQFFVMPGLVQVTNGINLAHPRFNVIPPGVSQEVFFPFSATDRRDRQRTEVIDNLLFSNEDEETLGHLDRPELPPIFTMARLDRIKNLTGLVEAYGRNEKLRECANLIVIAGTLHADRSPEVEEAAEIERMHTLIEQYQLHGSLRWLGKLLPKKDTGEVYRIIADHRGIMVQPALFEAFGLTILEAMHSGLPVFATKFGGPLEIVEHGTSGFLINPTDYASMTGAIHAFLAAAAADPAVWLDCSAKGLARAQGNFTWELHCRRLARMAKVYGFWKYGILHTAKAGMDTYCDLLYNLFIKPRAASVQ